MTLAAVVNRDLVRQAMRQRGIVTVKDIRDATGLDYQRVLRALERLDVVQCHTESTHRPIFLRDMTTQITVQMYRAREDDTGRLLRRWQAVPGLDPVPDARLVGE